jgi:uncharacterized protein YuzE
MKIEYDNEIDSLYIRLQEKHVERTLEIEEGLNIDFDKSGRMIGLEVLDAVDRYSLSDVFNIATENLVLDRTMVRDVA